MSFLTLGTAPAIALLLLTTGLIIYLYWLKPPPKRVVVPSTILWQRVLQERKRRSDFWRWLVSLAIALLVGLALASAVGKPGVDALGQQAQRLAIILDNSPSMGARTSSGSTRWEAAMRHARGLVSSGSPASEFLVADTAGQLVVSGFAPRSRALEHLDQLELSLSSDVRYPESEALRSNVDSGGAEALFLTDGVMVKDVPGDVTVISFFEPAQNVGITAFDVKPVPAEPTRYEAFVEVVNHSNEAKRVAFSIDGAQGVAVSHAFSIDPGGTVGESFDLEGFVAGPVRALVDASDDALSSDNVAYAYLSSPQRLRVHLVTDGNPYLAVILGLDPRVELTVSSRAGFRASDVDADVYVFDQFAPEDPPAGPALLFRPSLAAWLPSLAGEDITQVSLAGSSFAGESTPYDDFSLLHHVSLEDVVVESSLRLDAAEHRVAVGTALEPIVLLEEFPQKWIVVSFALSDSNFPLQASFPIFLSNAITWLSGTEVSPETMGTIAVAIPNAVVTDIDGSEVPTRFLGARTAFTPSAPGIFSVHGAQRELVVTANLMSPIASAINDSALDSSEESLIGRLAASGELSELWVGLLLFALLILLVEWWTYHRRMTV